MELTILLSKVFGVYFLIVSALVFLNRKGLLLSVRAMAQERFAELTVAVFAILGGLFYINIYQDYSTTVSCVLSVIGWLTLIKGLVLAFLPQAHLEKMTSLFSKKMWYTLDGVLALIAGLYLAGFGYGLF